MERLEKINNILEKYGQEHLIAFTQELSEKEQEQLINQIEKVDFELLKSLYAEVDLSSTENVEEKISPMEYFDKYKMSEEDIEKYTKLGEQILRDGKFAFVLMAGGQGTRLGHEGPKGSFMLGINPDKSLFEIKADSLKKAKESYGVYIPWYIMTSTENNDDTIAFFEKNNYFGYPKEMVMFFKQGELPMLDTHGRILLESKGKIREAADGHGGVFEAMLKNGVVEDMKKRGVEWIFIGGIDNVLLNMVDALQIGISEAKKTLISSKSVVKANSHEKVGVFCKRNGRPSVIEYSEISTEMAEMEDQNGELVYGESHILCNLFNIQVLEKIGHKRLPLHRAFKKISYIDGSGNEINPESPNAYKFEAFLFDAFSDVEDMVIIRVKREEEFAPVKNKEGVDSPDTARELYNNYWR